MPNNELNLADFQKIIFLNNIEESSDLNNIFKYGENSNEKFDFAVFFTEQNKSNISNLEDAGLYPNKIINIWNKGQRLNRFIGIDKSQNEISIDDRTYKLSFDPNNGLISIIDQTKKLIINPDPNKDALLRLYQINYTNQRIEPIPSNLHSEIEWSSSNSDIELDPPNGADNTLCKIKDSVKTYGEFTLETTSNEQTPDHLNEITLTITWNSLNGTAPSHEILTDITAKLTGYQSPDEYKIKLIKDAVCPSSNEIKVRIDNKEYAIPNWNTTTYTGNLQLTNWSLTPGTYNITTIAPAIENGNGSLQITVTEITPRLLIGLNSSSLNVYNASTNNTISKTYDGTALYATVSIKDPTNHLQSINRQFNGTITYWEDGKNTIHEVQYVGTPIQLTGVSITNIDGNKNSIKLHVQFTPNRNDNTYIYYGAIQNAEITLQLNQKPSTLTLTGVTTTYDGTNYYIKGKPSVTGTIYYKEYIGNNIPNKEELKRYGFKVLNAVANKTCNLSDIHPISVCTDHIAAYLDPDDDSYDDSSVVTADIVINKTNTSLVFNGSSDVYDGNRHGSFDVKITASPAVDGKLYYATSENLFTKFSSVNTSDYNGTTATVRVDLPFDMQQANVGYYTIYVKFIPDNTQDYNESTTNGTFRITQSSSDIVISDYSAEYNGSKQGYIRVTSPFSGKVYYGLEENNLIEYPQKATPNTPLNIEDLNIRVKHVNESSPRIVYIQFEPDDANYKNSTIRQATITIKKAKPILTLSASAIQYNNTANKAYVTVTGKGTDQMIGTIYYIAGDVITNQTQVHKKKYNNATTILDNVSQTDAGSINLTAQFVPDNTVVIDANGVKLSDDYESSDAKTITITVNKASQSAPRASGDTKEYPNSVEATASGGGQQGSLIWIDADNGNATSNKMPANTLPTSKNIQAYWSGNNNYEPSPTSNTVTIKITKGEAVIPSGTYAVKFNGSKLTYDGNKKVLVDTSIINSYSGTIYWYVSTSSDQPIWSTPGKTGWSLEIPSKIEPGTYYVWYYVKLDTNLYNYDNTSTFYNTVTKVTSTSAASGTDGYETNHKTIYKNTPTIKINGNTVTNSPVTGYTGTYNGNYQGSFTLTSSVEGYGDYAFEGSDTPSSIDTINANQTITIDIGNELGIKDADTYQINVQIHPSDTTHYNHVTIQVNIIINAKKLDKPQLTGTTVTYPPGVTGVQPSITVYKVNMNGQQSNPDIEWYYRQSTSNTWTTSSSVPTLTTVGSIVVKAIYKNSTGGKVDNNWASSDQSNEVTVTLNKRTVTITPPEFNTTALSYDRVKYTLIKSGTGSCTTGGTMYYYLSKNSSTTPTWSAANASNSSSGWSTNIPTATDGGSYYVWWICYVSDTTNNTGTNINTVNRISGYKNINMVNPYSKSVPELVGTILYDGNPHNLLQGGAMQHSSSNNVNVPGTFTYQQGTAIGTYTNPTWSWEPTGNNIGNYKPVSGTVNGTVNIVELSFSLELDGGKLFEDNKLKDVTYVPAEILQGYISVNPANAAVINSWSVRDEDKDFADIWNPSSVNTMIRARRTGNIAPNFNSNKKVVVTASSDNITKTIDVDIKDIVAFYKYNDDDDTEWKIRLQDTLYAGDLHYGGNFQLTYADFHGPSSAAVGPNQDIVNKNVIKIGIGTKCTSIADGFGNGNQTLKEVIIASSVVAIGTSQTYTSPVGYKQAPDDLNNDGGAFQGCYNIERVVFKWNSKDYGNRYFRYICGSSFVNPNPASGNRNETNLKTIIFEDPLPPICSNEFLNFIKNYKVTVKFKSDAYKRVVNPMNSGERGWNDIYKANPDIIKKWGNDNNEGEAF